jgi:hypothetical protein
MTDKELLAEVRSLRGKVNELEQTVDRQDGLIGALVENVNFLRGDKQREADPPKNPKTSSD